MSRVQLALNVSDLDRAVDFYTKLFGTEPAKLRPGYANFAVADPPLKLVLIEGERGASLNHLGVEVESSDEVFKTQARLAGHGLPTAVEDNVACCYARQDKVWVEDPDGAPWEVYTVLEDVELLPEDFGTAAGDGTCRAGACGVPATTPAATSARATSAASSPASATSARATAAGSPASATPAPPLCC